MSAEVRRGNLSKFEEAINLILSEEGGYVNDPHDSGGETKYGISKNAYPEINIGSLTLDQAKAIYMRDYWEPCKCDNLPWPLSLFVLDAAVNQGTDAAIKMLQHTLQTNQDGIIGSVTLRLAKESRKWHWARFMAFRTMRYQGTRNYDSFVENWLISIFRIAIEA